MINSKHEYIYSIFTQYYDQLYPHVGNNRHVVNIQWWEPVVRKLEICYVINKETIIWMKIGWNINKYGFTRQRLHTDWQNNVIYIICTCKNNTCECIY